MRIRITFRYFKANSLLKYNRMPFTPHWLGFGNCYIANGIRMNWIGLRSLVHVDLCLLSSNISVFPKLRLALALKLHCVSQGVLVLVHFSH